MLYLSNAPLKLYVCIMCMEMNFLTPNELPPKIRKYVQLNLELGSDKCLIHFRFLFNA